MLSDVDHAVGVIYETQRHPDESSPEWAKRRTYLIDPEGVIRKAYRVRDTETHPGEVLEDLRRFQSNG
jgi:peroxiredoxin